MRSGNTQLDRVGGKAHPGHSNNHKHADDCSNNQLSKKIFHNNCLLEKR